MTTTRLVTWISSGQAWTRCERHAPATVRAYLDNPPAGLIHVETITTADAASRCITCLAAWLRLNA